MIKDNLGQSSAAYLIYLLFSFIKYEKIENGQATNSVQIGLAIGPPIAIGNMIVSVNANDKFYQELMENDLNMKIVNSGETVYGLIGIKNYNFEPLIIKGNNIGI